MSCRVLGMEIETAVLHAIVEGTRERQPGGINARIVQTASNMPCRALYSKAGFRRGLLDLGYFELKAHAQVAMPDHIDLEVSHRQHV